MSTAADAYIAELQAEKRGLQEQVNAGFTLVHLLQQVAEKRGHPFGLPVVGTGVSLDAIRQMIATLSEEVRESAEPNKSVGREELRELARSINEERGKKSVIDRPPARQRNGAAR